MLVKDNIILGNVEKIVKNINIIINKFSDTHILISLTMFVFEEGGGTPELKKQNECLQHRYELLRCPPPSLCRKLELPLKSPPSRNL